MTTSEKKSLLVSCPVCECVTSGAHFGRHTQHCSSDSVFLPNTDSFPGYSFIFKRTLTGRIAYVAPQTGSRNKLNVDNRVFLHPKTMDVLSVVMEGPAILTGDSFARVVSIWPADNIEVMDIGVAETSDKTLKQNGGPPVKLEVLANWRYCSKMILRPRITCLSFFSSDSFMQYVRDTLSGSYCLVCDGVSVWYYGQECVFEIINYEVAETNDFAIQLDNLSLQENKSARLCLLLSNQTTYRITNSDNISTVKLSDIGGEYTTKAEFQMQLLTPINLWPNVKFGIRKILLYGPTGFGKTLFLEALKNELVSKNVPVETQKAFDWLQSDGELEFGAKLDSIVKSYSGPLLLTVDEFDVICSSKETDNASKSSFVLLDFMDKLPSHVWFLVVIRDVDKLDLTVRRRFDSEIELTVPTAEDRREIFQILAKRNGVDRLFDETCLNSVAESAHGYTAADLDAVCKRALTISQEQSPVSEMKLWESLRGVRPSALREITLEVPKVCWSDVGGQEELKLRLKQAVEWPLTHAKSFARLGVPAPCGVLLYGPPGCSKTMVARAVATESGLNFLAVKGPELFSKYVGESERAVRSLFQRARRAAPAVVFFDEIDALAVSRGGSGGAVGDRVLAQLLTELDGLESLGGVTVLAATNRPDLIDRALLRPGRLDRVIYVPLPEAETRRAIIELQFSKMPVAADVTLGYLVSETEGYSGAELIAVCNEGALAAMREDISCATIELKHIQQGLKAIRPMTDNTLLKIFEKFQISCGLRINLQTPVAFWSGDTM